MGEKMKREFERQMRIWKTTQVHFIQINERVNVVAYPGINKVVVIFNAFGKITAEIFEADNLFERMEAQVKEREAREASAGNDYEI